MAVQYVTLEQIDHLNASKPEMTGRPLEMFVDASDYGYTAVLTQKPGPGQCLKIAGIVAKAFSDVQLRWSAMERELYAL